MRACRSTDDVQAYIIANDGLSDQELDGLEFIEVGPGEDFDEALLDSVAKKSRRGAVIKNNSPAGRIAKKKLR